MSMRLGKTAGAAKARRLALLGAVVVLLFPLVSGQLLGASERKGEDPSGSRRLFGTVFDKSGHPAAGAVVYLENQRSLAINTYITGTDGSYRFNSLSPDADYEVYAEAGGQKSGVKSLSSFDSHKQAHINLRLGK